MKRGSRLKACRDDKVEIASGTPYPRNDMDNSMNELDVLTVKDTADLLKLSEMTILRLANQGLIPGAKIGRQWRFSKTTILQMVKHPEILRRGELRA